MERGLTANKRIGGKDDAGYEGTDDCGLETKEIQYQRGIETLCKLLLYFKFDGGANVYLHIV